MMKSYIVSKEESGQLLEKFVKKCLPNAPLSFIYKLFRKKDVKVNGHWQDAKYKIEEDDEIKIFVTDEQFNEFVSSTKTRIKKDISGWIVYEDNNIMIINKPRGVLVQKDASGDIALDDLVVSYLIDKKEYNPEINIGFTPAPIHRLDRNTAGLIIFGKNIKTLQELGSLMQDKSKITKKYLTLVEGNTDDDGRIDYSIKKLNNGRVIRDDNEGKDAHTLYKKIKTVGNCSLLEVTLLTGRTHQIRVHFSLIGHPVIGDAKYGNYALNKEIEKKYGFKNQFLVAYYLKFNNLTGEYSYLNGSEFKIDLDNEFMDILDKLIDNK